VDRTPAQVGSGREEKQAPRAGDRGRRRPWPRPGSGALPGGGPRRQGLARGKRQGEDRILSLPNAVTTVRLVLIPVFVWLLAEPRRRGWFTAAILLAALGITDGLDGQLARRLGQVTNLGKVLDTVADRVLLATAVIGALAVGAVPVGIAVATIAREGVVATSAVALALAGARRIDVVPLGKAGTFGLMCAFPLFLAGSSPVGWHHLATVLAWVAAVAGLTLAWASLAMYAPRARLALTDRHTG
jgi:cardiolipin synthase